MFALHALPPLLRAALWMGGALVSFMAMAVSGRELSAELSTFGILFFRSAIGLALVALLLSRSGWGQVRSRRPGLHLLRNMVHYVGQFGWFYGIALIPLTEVFAIEFTTPIWTAVLAVLVLGERLTRARAVAVALGFLGILVILRPGVEVVSLGALAVLIGAFGFAGSFTCTKLLTRSDSALAILFYMTLLQMLFSAGPALADWVLPSPALWPWLLLVGVTALSAHYSIARALALADAIVVVPMDFLRLPLIALVGWLLYGETLESWVLLGAALVCFGVMVNLRGARAAG